MPDSYDPEERERAYLRRRGFTDVEIRLLETNAPRRAELRRARAYLGEHKRALTAHKRVLRASLELLEALRAPEVSTFSRHVNDKGELDAQEGRRPDRLEELLEGKIAFTEFMLEALRTLPPLRPFEGLERSDELRLFVTLLDLKLRRMRETGQPIPGLPSRELGPKDLEALFAIANPQIEASEDAMKKATARARKKR